MRASRINGEEPTIEIGWKSLSGSIGTSDGETSFWITIEDFDRKQQRVAIGLRTRRAHRADRTAGAGDILDDDGAPELRRQPIGNDARDGIHAAAGAIGHDHR